MFSRIGYFFRSVSGWLYFFANVVPFVTGFIAATFESLPWSQRVLVAVASAASGSILVYYILGCYEFISTKYGFRREVNRVADQLEVMLRSGHEYLKIQFIADMWADDNKDKDWIWNPRMRKIKDAVSDGDIQRAPEGNRNPNKNSAVRVEDVVRFFRGLKSL